MGGGDAAFEEALSTRREVLGSDYVDAALANDSPGEAEFQRFVTQFAWGTWARPGLKRRDRSLLVLAMTGALGRIDEFSLHLGAADRNGVTDSEVDELVLQVVAYAGAPAGVTARRAVRAFRRERETHPSP